MASDEPTLVYYDANGKKVKEGDASATRQFLSDDPARPDSDENKTAAKAVEAPPEDKAVSGPAEKK